MDASTRNGYKHKKWIQAHKMDTSTRNGYKHLAWIHAPEMDTHPWIGYTHMVLGNGHRAMQASSKDRVLRKIARKRGSSL